MQQYVSFFSMHLSEYRRIYCYKQSMEGLPMDQNLNQITEMMQQNKGAILRLMQSADGKALIDMMRKQTGGENLNAAAAAAAKGNTAQLAGMVRSLMATEDGAKMVERITGELNRRK